VTCNASPSVTHEAVGIARELENPAYVQEDMMRTERRLSRRLSLRWRLRLSGASIGIVETKTENLSSRGFYCYLESPVVPGEVVTCTISMPSYSASNRLVCSLVCQAEVIRIEAVGPTHGFGVAWRIIDYTVERREEAFATAR
jgi:hypothetical protein